MNLVVDSSQLIMLRPKTYCRYKTFDKLSRQAVTSFIDDLLGQYLS